MDWTMDENKHTTTVSRQSTNTSERSTLSLVEKLARLFQAHKEKWIDGRELAAVGGTYAWRTRVADLRRAPYTMNVENRQRRVRQPNGTNWIVSEYRYLPSTTASDTESAIQQRPSA